ncbi:EAL domain-containing protein [Vibrio mexicanus]|uniref:EAL domain-containing protein n=1 Tax=Vibrio mexicanus TaxID=1004326 RepID=UPI000AB28538|nr:EAL domain-containing protein [Vibrio mexicanus]
MKSGLVSLKSLFTSTIVLLVLLLMLISTSIQNASYDKLIGESSRENLSTLTSNVIHRLDWFLSAPFLVNTSLAQIIDDNMSTYDDDLRSVENTILTSFKALENGVEHIDMIGFSDTNGRMVGFHHRGDHEYLLILRSDRTERELVMFSGKSDDSLELDRRSGYEPRSRPWYVGVENDKKPKWTGVYTNADARQDRTLSTASPVFRDEEFLGVVVTDVKTETVGEFLAEQHRISGSHVFIFTVEGELIANSFNSEGSDHEIELSDTILKNIGQVILDHALTSVDFMETIQGEKHHVRLTRYQDGNGIEWLVAAAISEASLVGALRNGQTVNLFMMGLFATVFTIGAVLIIRRMTLPISKTAALALQFSKGDWQYTNPKSSFIREIDQLVAAFTQMAKNLSESVTSLKHQVIYDRLTGIYSHDGFIEVLEEKLEHRGATLMVIGIDNYRDLYCSHGRERGEQLIKTTAERLTRVIPESAILGRFDNDLFVVYIPQCESSEQINQLERRIRRAVTLPIHHTKEVAHLAVSIGAAQHSSFTSDEEWLHNASIAQVWALGTIQKFSLFDHRMTKLTSERRCTIERLHKAIENFEFSPFYQSIVSSDNGELVAVEALARWLCPKRGLISPAEFISVAEESNLIDSIGEQILFQACVDTKRAIKEGVWPESIKVHVNVTVDQISSPVFSDYVREVLSVTSLPASNLGLEITESKLVTSEKVAIKNMHKLQLMGIELSIDDFGTGYSSLAYLTQLPVNCLKIDRMFIEQLNEANANDSIAAAVIKIAKSLDLDIIAEGIETQEQFQILQSLKCPKIQGFYFGRPVPLCDWFDIEPVQSTAIQKTN